MRFGITSRPALGTSVNGDASVILEWNGQTLLAVIDGVGHGEEAAVASLKAKEYIQANYTGDIEEIMSGLNMQLRGTRGAVIGLVRIDRHANELLFCGIGNVDLSILGEPPMHPACMDGIVGGNIKRIIKFEYVYRYLKAVVMYSDGISRKFDLLFYSSVCEQPQTIADRIMSDWGKKEDDATILIAVEDEQEQGIKIAEIDASSDVRALTAAEQARELAKELGFSEVDQDKIAIATSELARNIVVHANGNGKITINPVTEGGKTGVMIIAKDSGPGIADTAKALEGGRSTKNGLGIGLGGAKRLMDELRIETKLGKGTTVTTIKWRN